MTGNQSRTATERQSPAHDPNKLVSSGLTEQYNGIPVISETEDVCSLAVGNKYLFCTSRDGGDSDSVINLTQFVYRIDSDNATAIIKASK